MSKKAERLENTVDESAEEALEELEQEYAVTENANRCPECSNLLDVIDLGPRTMHRCEGCSYRKTFKK